MENIKAVSEEIKKKDIFVKPEVRRWPLFSLKSSKKKSVLIKNSHGEKGKDDKRRKKRDRKAY